MVKESSNADKEEEIGRLLQMAYASAFVISIAKSKKLIKT